MSACGGHGDGGGGVPLSQLGRRLLDVGCEVSARCGRYPDKASCLAATPATDLDQLMASVAAGKTRYAATAAAACLEEIRSEQGFASCSHSVVLNSGPLTACQATFTGTQGSGASCLLDEECVSAHCEKTSCGADVRCCLGVCAPSVTPIAIGATCALDGSTACAEGAYCKDTPGELPVCAAKIAAGQPCDHINGAEQCAAGTICIFGEPITVIGYCLKLPAEGAPCFWGNGCDSLRDQCLLPPTGGSPTCMPRVAVGGSCALGVSCVAYADCDPVTQICVARRPAGAACGTPTGETACLGSLQCIGDRCTLPPPEPLCQ